MSLFGRFSKPPKVSADKFTDEMSSPGKGKRPVYSPGPAAPSRAVQPPIYEGLKAREELMARPVQADRNVACMVTHGMGQQVPFETVSLVAEAVKGKAEFQANRVRLTPDGDLLPRLECSYVDTDGVRTNVHLYEGYWAPLTEDKINFWQTISFLYSGGVAGLSTCLRRSTGHKFDRWMFGDVRELPIKPGTLNFLFWTLVAVSITILVYVAFLHVLAGAPEAFRGHPVWPPMQSSLRHPDVGEVFKAFGNWAWQWLALAFHHIRALALLLLAYVYTHYLNYFVVQYAGDVAIYVSSYKVSKFEETRTAIEKTVFTVGSQIYQTARDASGTPLYDEVVLVGHSLGSVITYDLLNRLIVWDQKQCAGRERVAERTTNLITFGSPLDKTAYLFRTQISSDHHYREALAGLQQPLILTYAVRPKTFEWINLYSPMDIISGSLQYYDDPNAASGPPVNPVRNYFDRSAWKPVFAHTQYWTGNLLAETLTKALFTYHPTVVAAEAQKRNTAAHRNAG